MRGDKIALSGEPLIALRFWKKSCNCEEEAELVDCSHSERDQRRFEIVD
jgi:hypothetical protein